MKNRTILILLYTLAIALLFGFSFLPSGFRVYRTILSLFLPFAIGVGIFVKKNGTKPPMYQGVGADALPYLLFAPILLGILLLSVLTTLLFSLVGLSNPPIDKIPIGEAIVLYALLPAILEEALYRILPALALCDEDTHSVCIFSTLVFSLAHISIFSIPYALFAGLSFFLVNRLARNPLPSILLHLANNLLSLLLSYATNQAPILLVMISSLVLLSAVSLFMMAKFYREETTLAIQSLRKKREPFRFTVDLLIYLAFTLTMTILFI